jgi:hypothetical protein
MEFSFAGNRERVWQQKPEFEFKSFSSTIAVISLASSNLEDSQKRLTGQY